METYNSEKNEIMRCKLAILKKTELWDKPAILREQFRSMRCKQAILKET